MHQKFNNMSGKKYIHEILHNPPTGQQQQQQCNRLANTIEAMMMQTEQFFGLSNKSSGPRLLQQPIMIPADAMTQII